MSIVDWFKYLGGIIARNGGDARDVDSRIESAGKASGALRGCLFTSTSITRDAKRAVYEGLVLAILLYGCESWCLTEVLWQRLRVFHAQCVRSMSRVTRKHTREHHLSTQALEQEMGLDTIDVYVDRRRLRWLGHVSRMDFDRLPRKMLSSWVTAPRPAGAPQMTYGRSICKALAKFNVPIDVWPELAADRAAWRETLQRGFPPASFQPSAKPLAPQPLALTRPRRAALVATNLAMDASLMAENGVAPSRLRLRSLAPPPPPQPQPPPPQPPTQPPPLRRSTRRGRGTLYVAPRRAATDLTNLPAALQ